MKFMKKNLSIFFCRANDYSWFICIFKVVCIVSKLALFHQDWCCRFDICSGPEWLAFSDAHIYDGARPTSRILFAHDRRLSRVPVCSWISGTFLLVCVREPNAYHSKRRCASKQEQRGPCHAPYLHTCVPEASSVWSGFMFADESDAQVSSIQLYKKALSSPAYHVAHECCQALLLGTANIQWR